jgi:hypothetical protein
MIVWYGRRPGSIMPLTSKQPARFCTWMPVPGVAHVGEGVLEGEPHRAYLSVERRLLEREHRERLQRRTHCVGGDSSYTTTSR